MCVTQQCLVSPTRTEGRAVLNRRRAHQTQRQRATRSTHRWATGCRRALANSCEYRHAPLTCGGLQSGGLRSTSCLIMFIVQPRTRGAALRSARLHPAVPRSPVPPPGTSTQPTCM